MQPFIGRVAAIAGVTAALLASSGSIAEARDAGSAASKPRIVFLTETVGCADVFHRLLCDGFVRATRGARAEARIVTPAVREDVREMVERVARQRWDLITVFGNPFAHALATVAPRYPRVRFTIIDRSVREVPGLPRNVGGVIFRTSEAAFVAGYLAARMEQRRPGRDAVGIVAGFSILSVQDFVIGFRAGARRAAPGIRIFVDFSNDFVDPAKCRSIARRQIARGAGVIFNVAGVCGLGALEAAEERGVWGIGVDTDQSFLGSHILTSVLKDFEAGFAALFRQLKAGRLRTGRDTVMTLREGAVGLGTINRRVPASLRAELARLERRVARGAIRVPGAFADPR